MPRDLDDDIGLYSLEDVVDGLEAVRSEVENLGETVKKAPQLTNGFQSNK